MCDDSDDSLPMRLQAWSRPFMVIGKELCLPCDQLFSAPTDRQQHATHNVVYLTDQLHDIHHYKCQHLKVACDRMKACYGCLANYAEFQEGDKVWLCYLTWTTQTSPYIQSACVRSTEGDQMDQRHGLKDGSSTIWWQRWWWYTWKDWHHTLGLLRTSSP
jgi:hypothetical protein